MKALLLIDIQNDFCPGGKLAVNEGDQIVSVVNDLQPHFDLVIAAQDWHPPDHGSFASNHEGHEPYEVIKLNGLEQVLWPDHCLQDSEGAEFRSDLDQDRIERVFRKGSDPTVDSYRGLFDNGRRNSTGIGEYLKEKGATGRAAKRSSPEAPLCLRPRERRRPGRIRRRNGSGCPAGRPCGRRPPPERGPGRS